MSSDGDLLHVVTLDNIIFVSGSYDLTWEEMPNESSLIPNGKFVLAKVGCHKSLPALTDP